MNAITADQQATLLEVLFNKKARNWGPAMLATLQIALLLLLMATCLLAPEPAHAAGIFTKIGTVLSTLATDATDSGWMKWVGVIAIVIGGILFTVGELNGPFGYVIRIVAGLSVASGAVALGSTFV